MFDGEPPRDAQAPVRHYWLVTAEAPGFSGGIGVYTHQTAMMFAARGVAVTVLHHDAGVHDPVCGFADGYRLIRFAGRGLDRRPIAPANLQGPLRIAREIDAVVCALAQAEGPPDVVEFPDFGAPAWAFLKRRLMHAEASWPRVVLTAHRPHLHCVVTDEDSPHEHSTAFLAEAERWCYAAADAVFAPCRFILGPLAALGFPLPRAEVVHNPYDAPRLAGMRPSARMGPDAVRLSRLLHTDAEPALVFGKLQRQKGAPDLLAALDALHTEGEAPALWMFGRDAFLSGSPTTAYDALEQRHRRLFEGGGVRYFGGYSTADVRALCAAHPIGLLPYREDCLPYAFIETVLAGAIPLVSLNGGQAELIPADLHALLGAEVSRPDVWRARLRRLMALTAAERARLSERLATAVRAATAHAAVFARKMSLLAQVRPAYRDADYPFVHPEAKRYETPDRARQARLADAVPQLGATRRLARTGPALRPSADLITVVVPYFDMHAYVDETLASLEAQDHPAVEVVIVDDGSRTAEAAAALERLLAAPRRFPTRVLRKTNGGLADARNAGARMAQGDYLYFLDADDVIHPSTLSRSLAVLKRFANVGYVGAGLKEFGESEAEWTVFDIDGPYIGFHNLQICAFLVRAQAWLEHGVNDPGMSIGMEDYESHVRMFCAGVRGVALPETLFSYRKRAGSMSKAFEPHGVAQLYRRIWRNTPALLHRFGPELVGLYAENGHGALAPAVGRPTAQHRALFERDIPSPAEIADGLEVFASRERLGRALRARCAVGGPEWDYTTARLLMALDREPAFARELLHTALRHSPENGWFRLYAMLSSLRDGRIGEAQALWCEPFDGFCRREAAAIAWILDLEAVRGFPHVAFALRPWLAARADVATPPAPLHLGAGEPPATGDFAELHDRLDGLRGAWAAADSRRIAEAERAVGAAAAERLSAETAAALLARWGLIWREASTAPSSSGHATFWSRGAQAYVGPGAAHTAASDPLEVADRDLWTALRDREPGMVATGVVALGKRLRRRALAALETV